MKDKIITITFVAFISIFSILHIVIPDEKISKIERRYLETFPSFTFSNEYSSKVEKYLLDNFPYRDTFRKIKSNYNYYLLNKIDNKMYVKDNYIFKSLYPINENSINNFVSKINKMGNYFPNSNKYFMLIPDKGYYLKDNNYLQIDYDEIINGVNSFDMNMVNIFSDLSIDDYYETDAHWRQEKLEKVVKRIASNLNLNYEKDYYKENVFDNFYGVYFGELALTSKNEKLIYLTNDIINDCYVSYLENSHLHSIYNVSKLDGIDSYDVYLDGASSFISIYNPNYNGNRELIVFRDSFGSSLIPLLVKYYSKIIVIDNRYISMDNVTKMFNIDNQDVLFMYSTGVVNDSFALRG